MLRRVCLLPSRKCTPHLRKRSYAELNILELVKLLRKETGAGIGECREAAAQFGQDIGKAKQWLIQKAAATAAKKKERAAVEGAIVAFSQTNTGVIVEMNCETDFAAREATFTGLLRDIAQTSISNSKATDAGAVSALPYTKELAGRKVDSIGEALLQLSGLLRENVQLRRVVKYPQQVNDQSRVYSYIHAPVDTTKPPVGLIGVLLHTTVSGSLNPKQEETTAKFANQICLQIAGMNPLFIDSPPPDYKPAKKEDGTESTDEVSLLKQTFLFNQELTVGQALEKFQKENTSLQLKEFVRWKVGEGLVKAQTNLGDEVAKLLK